MDEELERLIASTEENELLRARQRAWREEVKVEEFANEADECIAMEKVAEKVKVYRACTKSWYSNSEPRSHGEDRKLLKSRGGQKCDILGWKHGRNGSVEAGWSNEVDKAAIAAVVKAGKRGKARTGDLKRVVESIRERPKGNEAVDRMAIRGRKSTPEGLWLWNEE
ncbi:hypothetical protein EV426DRAFT_705389 [Tirmania nivea]|nr:hypothetical protein EV426DRAFT_705389 [Tirmania nivea]